MLNRPVSSAVALLVTGLLLPAVEIAGAGTSALAQTALAAPIGALAAGAADAAATSRGATPHIELANAERLSIRFQGYADLTGEYRVAADATISVPVLGRIDVASLSPVGLEKLLARRVARISGKETYVSVEIVEYRGVFVTGFVTRPGAYPWRPGMTVLHVVALAGGTFRTSGEGGAPLGEDSIVVDLQKATSDQMRNLAKLARLKAERAGQSSIEAPKRLLDLVGAADAAEVINAERSALISRRAVTEAKKLALARATEMARRELTGLTAQQERLKVRLGARMDHKTKIEALQAKGIVRADRSMEEYARVAELEDRNMTVAVGIARVQATLAALEQDRVNLEYGLRAELDQQIINISRDIARLEIEMVGARDRYRKLTGQEPARHLVAAKAPKFAVLSYKIVRQSTEGAAGGMVEPMSPVKPGDIVVVAQE